MITGANRIVPGICQVSELIESDNERDGMEKACETRGRVSGSHKFRLEN